MARRVSRGEIWLYEFKKPDKRRPVLILTRDDVIPWVHTVLVAPITSTARGLPTEVTLGVEEGLKGPSVAKLDGVLPVPQANLKRYAGTVSASKMREVCRALAIAAGCA